MVRNPPVSRAERQIEKTTKDQFIRFYIQVIGIPEKVKREYLKSYERQ